MNRIIIEWPPAWFAYVVGFFLYPYWLTKGIIQGWRIQSRITKSRKKLEAIQFEAAIRRAAILSGAGELPANAYPKAASRRSIRNAGNVKA